MAETGGPRYRFGPRSTRGLLAGWRGGQIACVAVGTLVGLALLRSIGGGAGALLGISAAAGGAAVATLPVSGRSLESWAPTVARHVAAQAADPATSPWMARERRSPFRDLAIRTAISDEGALGLGVVEDRRARTWTAVLPVGGVGFALLDVDGRAGAIAAWAGVLAAVAADGRPGMRLQWIARTYPSCVAGRTERAGIPAGPPGATTGRDYATFLEEADQVLWERELLVALRVPATRGPANQGPAHLGHAVRALGDRLAAAGLSAGSPLDESELAGALRRAHASESRSPGATSAFPIGVRAGWSSLRTDGTWHAAYWIAEWPRGDVGPAVLLPLFAGTGIRATVSCTMSPLAPVAAVRRAERERTSGAADAELRVRHGFSLTARARREQETRHQREDELAEGHAAFLFAGYVAVTAEDEGRLAVACEEIEQAAALAQLELRRLYGAQLDGWACTLPLGRGCR